MRNSRAGQGVMDAGPPAKGIRIYVARGTPNSTRAEANLTAAIRELANSGKSLHVETVDVLTEAKRAIRDSIIVTPTLIGFYGSARQILMGDLTDSVKLYALLKTVLDWDPAEPLDLVDTLSKETPTPICTD